MKRAVLEEANNRVIHIAIGAESMQAHDEDNGSSYGFATTATQMTLKERPALDYTQYK